MTSYKPFAANFEAHFAPEIFKAYMQCVCYGDFGPEVHARACLLRAAALS